MCSLDNDFVRQTIANVQGFFANSFKHDMTVYLETHPDQ